MFSISSIINMFSGKLNDIIEKAGGELKLSVGAIEAWALKERVPFKLTINDNKEIVIVKR